jgi:serine/threonine protein phosphatase PrpC
VCSSDLDGLTDVLSDESIRQMLSQPDRSPQQLGDALVSAANAMGGPDNITAVVVHLLPGE